MLGKIIDALSNDYTAKLDRLEAVIRKAYNLTNFLTPKTYPEINVNTVELNKELDEALAEIRSIRKELDL